LLGNCETGGFIVEKQNLKTGINQEYLQDGIFTDYDYFINGQKGFLSKSIYNVVPKLRDLIIFPNYLMHTAYPFNIEGERRSFSFNAKIIFRK